MNRIGLIAGNRRFPILFAQEAKKNNYSVVAVAIKGETSRSLSRMVDKMYWLALTDFTRAFDIFKSENIKNVVMAGQVSPARIFSREVRDSRIIQELLNSIKDCKTNTLFSALAQRLDSAGLKLMDSTTFLKDYLPDQGVLTRRQPTPGEWEDIRFGKELAVKVAELDIGLSVAVKQRAIVAVEALEGTDNLIKRSAKMCRQGLVIVKVGRPDQDMRFDIPVIGLATVQTIIRCGIRCMAIEAGKTLFLDMARSLQLADSKGVCIVAI